jgi:hypothetical protein
MLAMLPSLTMITAAAQGEPASCSSQRQVALHRNGESYPSTIVTVDLHVGQDWHRELVQAAQRSLSIRDGVLYSPGGRKLQHEPGDTAFVLRQGEMWKWPTHTVGHFRNISVLDDHARDGNVHLETLSTSPRVFRIRGLLDRSECAALRASAAGRWHPSGSFDTESGTHYALSDGRRFSDTAWSGLHWGEESGLVPTSPVIERLQRRAADVARVHIGHAEPWQVVRYPPGGFQRHHSDGFEDATIGSTRHVTLLAYLADVPEDFGVATQFPFAGASEKAFAFDPESCSQGLAVQPVEGDALLFYNAREQESPQQQPSLGVGYTQDESARHAACPLLGGEKYIGNVWLHPMPVNEAKAKCAMHSGDAVAYQSCMLEEARAR